jgi:uncharacterized protein YbaR (Trm112 family)
MVLIFGWGSGEAQDLGEIAPVNCPNCHNDVTLHHIKSNRQVSLFFVPLASYGTNDYLACPICRHGLQIPPEHREAVDRMQSATRLFRRGVTSAAVYQPQVEAFWQRFGVAPSGQQVVHPPSSIPPPMPGVTSGSATTAAPPPEPTLVEQLEGFARLHADGVLTDEEFAAVKRRVLGI